MKLFIVIGAYNEEKSIEKIIKDLLKHKYKNIIVVDDGSTDNTPKIALKAGAIILTHSINKGQGASLQTGIEYALKQKADIIVTFDADGQHLVKDIPAIIKPLKEGKADITLGSRFLGKAENIPLLKKLTLKGGIIFTTITAGIKLTDTHNGFRGFSRKAAQKIKITHDKMEHASEIIEKIKTKNLRYQEVPVTIKYTDYSMSKGQSIFNSLKIAKKILFKKVDKKEVQLTKKVRKEAILHAKKPKK